MTLTERHIECAHLCARLEVAGQEDTKVMARKWGVTRATDLQLVLQLVQRFVV